MRDMTDLFILEVRFLSTADRLMWIIGRAVHAFSVELVCDVEAWMAWLRYYLPCETRAVISSSAIEDVEQ